MISRTSALLSSLTISSISIIRKICTDSFNNLDACSACLQPPPTVLQPEVRVRFWIQIDNAELKLYHREKFRVLGLNVRMHQS